jgi:hypothetical protein
MDLVSAAGVSFPIFSFFLDPEKACVETKAMSIKKMIRYAPCFFLFIISILLTPLIRTIFFRAGRVKGGWSSRQPLSYYGLVTGFVPVPGFTPLGIWLNKGFALHFSWVFLNIGGSTEYNPHGFVEFSFSLT